MLSTGEIYNDLGGDYYSQYELNEKQCIRIRYKGESDLEQAAMKNAIDAWIASRLFPSQPAPLAAVPRFARETTGVLRA